MITATFIFRPLKSDADYEALNDRIDAVAAASKGYLGRKRWQNREGDLAVVYYWTSMEALDPFRSDSTHKIAKSRADEWYAGYRVEISTINEVYGDGYFDEDFPSE